MSMGQRSLKSLSLVPQQHQRGQQIAVRNTEILNQLCICCGVPTLFHFATPHGKFLGRYLGCGAAAVAYGAERHAGSRS